MEFYHSAEKKSVYSVTPADWVKTYLIVYVIPGQTFMEFYPSGEKNFSVFYTQPTVSKCI